MEFAQLTLVNIGQNTTLGNSDMTQQLVQLLVVSDSQLQVTGDDTSLFVVAGSVTGQLENFGSEVLENSSQVNRGTSANTLSIVALSEKTVDTTNRKCQTSLRRTPTQQD